MSGATIGGIAGGIAGALIGAPFGMAALGWTVGSTLGSFAGAAMDPTIIQQPGLNDKKLQTSQYGVMIGYIWGRFRTAGSQTWIGNNGEMVPHEQSSGGKSGGTEVQSESYTASWQLLFNKSTRVGQEALKSIDKWWCNGRVVNTEDINPTVYTGWALQLPDSSMEADLGVGEVPAERYKGSAVFNEVQMAQFFNTFPQLEALINTTEAQNGAITQVAYNEDTEWPTGSKVDAWTTDWSASPTLLNPVTSITEDYYYVEVSPYAHRNTSVGTYVYADGSTVKLWQDWTPADAMLAVGESGPVMGLGAGMTPLGAADFLADAGVEHGRYCHACALSADGRTLIALTSDSSDYADECQQWHRIINGVVEAEGTIDLMGGGELLERLSFGVCNRCGIGAASAGPLNVGSTVENNGKWIWSINLGTWGVLAPDFPAPPNPLVLRLLEIGDDNVLRQYIVDPTWQSYGGPQITTGSTCLYSTEEGYCGVIMADFPGNEVTYSTALYTRLDGEGEMNLGIILADTFELKPSSVGDLALTTDRYDVTPAYAVPVHGANLGAQMQKRNFIAMLEAAYNFDIVESDDGEAAFLKVVFRGGASVATIEDEDLGVHDEGEGPKPLLELIARIQDWELPARVNVQHYDYDQDYQIGSQSAQRAWPYVDNVTRIDLPIVMSASEARNIAKRELYRAHLERETYGWSTSRKWAHLEPTDVVTIQGRDLRILKKTETPTGVIRWEGVLSAPYIAEQTDDGAPAEGTTPNPPPGPKGATSAVFFDTAMVSDDDFDVGFYVAAAAAIPGATWSGYSLQKSADGGSTWAEVASTSTASIMGTVETPLGNFTGGNVPDYSNFFYVDMLYGTLESVTEDAAFAGANAFMLGREVGNYITAELVSEGRYKVSGLLRGRRGTEWAMGSHAADETFALRSTVLNVQTPPSEVGQARLYKAVTFDTAIVAATAVSFTNTAQSARCYAPVHLAGGPSASNAELIEFIPRTRKGGAWRDLVDITQADTPVQYVIEIWDAAYAVCARVFSGLTSPNVSYSSAEQVADFGDEQLTYYVTAAQVGQFGLGMRARAAVPGPGSTIDAPVDPVPPAEPPADPPVGGGAVDKVISYPSGSVQSGALVIGDTYVVKFTTTTAPASTSYISVAEFSSSPPYTRRVRLCTDVDGTTVVKTVYGNPATIHLGPGVGETPLLPTTDYYLIVTMESAPGVPSGPVGSPTDLGFTLLAS